MVRIPGFHYHAAAAAKSLQLCPTLCNLIDGSPQGSAIPGILQARTLERPEGGQGIGQVSDQGRGSISEGGTLPRLRPTRESTAVVTAPPEAHVAEPGEG